MIEGISTHLGFARLCEAQSVFNPSDALGPETYELRRTKTLAWLLDPKGSHSLGTAFAKETYDSPLGTMIDVLHSRDSAAKAWLRLQLKGMKGGQEAANLLQVVESDLRAKASNFEADKSLSSPQQDLMAWSGDERAALMKTSWNLGRRIPNGGIGQKMAVMTSGGISTTIVRSMPGAEDIEQVRKWLAKAVCFVDRKMDEMLGESA